MPAFSSSRGDRGAATACLALLSLATFIAPGTGLAAADPQTALPFGTFADIEADDQSRRVFVTPGGGGSTLAVLDFDGNLTDTLALPGGAFGMHMAGGRLYVALRDQGSIVALDPATLSTVASYPLGITRPRDIVEAAGKLWFSFGPTYEGGVGSLDPATGEVQVWDDNWYAPKIWTTAGAPSTLFVGELGLSPTTTERYDVSTGELLIVTDRFQQGYSNLQAAVASPDGQTFWMATGSPYRFDSFDTASLAPAGITYNASSYPNSVAVTPDATVFVSGTSSSYDVDVRVYRVGTSTPQLTYDFGGSGNTLYPDGLALSDDGMRVFAVSGRLDNKPTLHVLDGIQAGTPRARSMVSLGSSTPTVRPGGTAQVEGRVARADGTPMAGVTVTLLRTRLWYETQARATSVTDADGAFAFADSPAGEDLWLYEARWSGDASTFGSMSASVEVLVERAASTLTLVGPGTARYGEPLTLQGNLLQEDGILAPRTVRILRENPWGSTSTLNATTDASGSFSVTDVPSSAGVFTYVAQFDGDAATAPGSSDEVEVLVTIPPPPPARSATTLTYLGPSSAIYGSDIALAAQLEGPNSVKVAGRRIWFAIGDLTTSGVTDAQGVARATLAATEDPGTYDVTATFDGDETYFGSAATRQFWINWEHTYRDVNGPGIVYLNPSTLQFRFSIPGDEQSIKRDLRMQQVNLDPPGEEVVVIAFRDEELTMQATLRLSSGIFEAIVATSRGQYVLRGSQG